MKKAIIQSLIVGIILASLAGFANNWIATVRIIERHSIEIMELQKDINGMQRHINRLERDR